VRRQRALWQEQQKELPVERLVFIDESCAKTNMTRLRGRALKGRRLYDHVPGGQWHTTTMLGAIRHDGQTAVMVLEGAVDGIAFREYVRRVLAPTLRRDDLVICDNLSVHHDRQARELIEARGAQLLFLPAYSPDFNPIEPMWAKVKEYLRAAKARTRKKLLMAIGKALETVSAKDAAGFFSHAGYLCTIN